jgi:hypothetical protein
MRSFYDPDDDEKVAFSSYDGGSDTSKYDHVLLSEIISSFWRSIVDPRFCVFKLLHSASLSLNRSVRSLISLDVVLSQHHVRKGIEDKKGRQKQRNGR